MREEASMRYTQGRAEGDRPYQPSRQTLHQGRRRESASRRIGGEDIVCRQRRQLATFSILALCWSSMIMIFLASTRTVGAFSTTAPTTMSATSAEGTKSLASSTIVELSHLEYCNAAGKMNQGGESTSRTTANKKAPVIFLHGLLGNKRNFSSIARSLCGRLQQPRRILGLDLRNHGDNCLLPSSSTHHHHDMSYTSMARDVLHFMDANEMPTAELIGHSVGGKVAQYVSCRMMMRTIVCSGPVFSLYEDGC
jgi:triacylglycerol esterase/lipase EstA (alpha/beta hydrolase family)